ncbi:hypothetical protein THRCLA_11713 [Thraustotheca clavata]|uniref:C2H2-type domain-containing protein n=1 Tax=Thraustotheca clavata TaxID=74557 RepID=A0A1V9Y6X4_9STRA|nr:hypothetical protein THRCLA_11713 [Thraustotheca clavata]
MGGGIADIEPESDGEKPPEALKKCNSFSDTSSCESPNCKGCTSSPQSSTGESKKFVCPVQGCGRVFCSSSNLGRHVKAHSGLKPYACCKCSKRFGRAFTLARHEITHTGQKPYHCEICNKGFNTSGNLCRHRHIHEKEKNQGLAPNRRTKKRTSPLGTDDSSKKSRSDQDSDSDEVLDMIKGEDASMVDVLVNNLYNQVGESNEFDMEPAPLSGPSDTGMETDTENFTDVFSDFEMDAEARNNANTNAIDNATMPIVNPAQVAYSACLQMETALKCGGVKDLYLLAQQATQAAEFEMQDACMKYDDAGRRFGALCQVSAPTVCSAMCRCLVFYESEKNSATRLVQRSRRLFEQTCASAATLKEESERKHKILMEVVCASQDAASCLINASEAKLSELMVQQATAQEAASMMMGHHPSNSSIDMVLFLIVAYELVNMASEAREQWHARSTFVADCCARLHLGYVPTTTAMMLCHRFYAKMSAQTFPYMDIGASCIFLSTKITEKPRKLRDIMNVAYSIANNTNKPVPTGSEYTNMKERLLDGEQNVLRVLHFELDMNLPYNFLLNYTQLLRCSRTCVQVALTLASDFFYSPTSLEYDAHIIATGCFDDDLAAIQNEFNALYTHFPPSDEVVKAMAK